MSQSSLPTALVDELRRRGLSGLTRLLTARPDLCDSAAIDLPTLAVRALTAASVRSALAGLDADQLRVLIGLAAELDAAVLQTCTERPLAEVAAGLAEQALIWGEPARCIPTAASLLGPEPAGLAPVSSRPLSPDEITSRLAALLPADRLVLDRLTWGPPYGRVEDADRVVDLDSADSPIDRLLALGLLRPVDPATVLLPREVALVLRGGRVFDRDADRPELPQFEAPVPGRPESASVPAEILAGWLLGQSPPEDWRSTLATAAAQDHWVRLAHAREDGTLALDVARVLLIGKGSAYLVRRAGRRFTVPLSRVVSAEMIEPVVIRDLPASERP